MRSHNLYSDTNGKKTRLYHIWEDMKNRCNNSNNRRYPRYGGRGITVDPAWNDDYKIFYDWAMCNGYSDLLTIDRIEVDGNYGPDNCKWSTPKEQGNNRCTNKILEYNGISKTMSEWSDELGMPYHVIRNRIKRGWTVQRTLNTPPEKHNKRNKNAA